jgi:DNA-binding transcriptional ArsR family regulator
VETLRALADPVRLSILSALMNHAGQELPVMSVKELAADLGEPQTKLYRHVKQLESAGLIKAVASRVVSGIVEQRYQACQTDLTLGASLTKTEEASAAAEAAVAAGLELYRSRFFAAHRAGRITFPHAHPDDPRSKVILSLVEVRMTPDRAEAIRQRLRQVLDEVTEAEAEARHLDEDLVTVNMLVGFFCPEPRKPSYDKG